MPKPSQSGFKRFFYNQNLKRVKSNAKYKNLIEHTIMLAKKLEKEGMTKWVANALNRAQVKIKSYGITFSQIVSALEHKGISKLSSVIENNLLFVQKKGHNTIISTKREVIKKESTIIIGDAVAKKAPVKKAPTPKKEAAPKKARIKKETATKTPAKKAPVKKTSTPKKDA